MRARVRRRRMFKAIRRRHSVKRAGRFKTPAETITYHKIPRGKP